MHAVCLVVVHAVISFRPTSHINNIQFGFVPGAKSLEILISLENLYTRRQKLSTT